MLNAGQSLWVKIMLIEGQKNPLFTQILILNKYFSMQISFCSNAATFKIGYLI